MLRALLLDLDGTLVDTPQAIVDVTQGTLTALGLPPADPQAIKDGIGLPLPVALAQLIGTGPAGAADAVEIYRVLWRTHVTPRVPQLLYPGVRDGLSELKRADLRMAVVTGKAQDGADSTVAAAGLQDVFDVVLGYTSVANPKPAPDIALLAAEKLGVSADDSVVVGDSTHDLEMASRAGMRSIAVTYGALPEAALRAAGPTWVAHSFSEVVRIARGLANVRSP
ncbi:MAG TPA: HAD family hydrolase [Myxococcales bacterium]|nr:HAD family hydrolase [Myxococcales bacterium]